MSQLQCIHGKDAQLKKRFLRLPTEIFGRTLKIKEASESGKQIRVPSFCDKKLEQEILEEKHVLSQDFSIEPFLILEGKKTITRALVTFYENDDNAYVGFFESFNHQEAVNLLMAEITSFARKHGKKSLVGPLDASFWIRYRFKINYFDRTYTGEPLNPPYYPILWEKAGFEVSDHYYTNLVRIPTDKDQNAKCLRRLEVVKKRGYEIKHPTKDSFMEELGKIYDSLIRLFSTFPGFHVITKKQFLAMFSSLQYVLDYEYVELAYKDGELKGFMISIPNYEGLTNGKLTPLKILHILKVKKKPKEYITLYMGVEPDSLGLGGAFAEILRRKMQRDQVTSMAALIHDGKETGHYYEELHTGKIEYVFYRKGL